MPVKSADFLNVAEVICENNPQEIQVRCAISRSYYSMYHRVLEVLDNEPLQYVGKGSHSSLIHYLQTDAEHDESIDHSQLRRLSYMLNAEREKRVVADYRLEHQLDMAHAQASISAAKKLSELCNQLTGA